MIQVSASEIEIIRYARMTNSEVEKYPEISILTENERSIIYNDISPSAAIDHELKSTCS